mgnify:CR=1 FL=1
METTAIHLGIVDDDQLIVALLQAYLSTQEDVAIQFTANNGLECLAALDANPPPCVEILLVDLKMAHMDGVELIKILRDKQPNIKAIVVSSHYNDSYLGFMVKTGVAAFLPKGVAPQELLNVIREVHKQGFFLFPAQLESLRDQISARAAKPKYEAELLTEREVSVLRLIAQQKTAKEIADTLCITQRTVEGHKNNLFAKTGTKNIAGLVLFGLQHEIINLGEFPT